MTAFKTTLLMSLFSLLIATASSTPAFRWKQDETSPALEHMGKTLWKFHLKKGRHKPFFHPLATLDGEVLTIDQPVDHVWHHGLWYSFKFLNGVNFWEENPKTGLSDGITRVLDFSSETRKDFSARFSIHLEYENPKAVDPTKQKLIHETRIIEVSAPDSRGNYHIDFEHRFKALEDVTMDRTPLKGEPNGKSWGGYAGFSLRHHTDHRSDAWKFIAPGTEKPAHGGRYPWLAFMKQGEKGSIGTAIFDHPDNPRHPAAWYVSDTLPFYSPSFLFHSAWSVGKGDSFRQRYRVKVFSTALTKENLDTEWKRFIVDE